MKDEISQSVERLLEFTMPMDRLEAKELHDFKNNGVAGTQQYLEKRITRLTAQFNSKGDNDE